MQNHASKRYIASGLRSRAGPWSVGRWQKNFGSSTKTTTKAVNTLGTATFAEFWGTIVHMESIICVESGAARLSTVSGSACKNVQPRSQTALADMIYVDQLNICYVCIVLHTVSGPFNSIQCGMIICHAWNNWRGRDRGSGCSSSFHPLQSGTDS